MARDLDWGDVWRDADNEATMARLGRVLDDMDAAGEPMVEDEEVCEVCGVGDGPWEDVVATYWTGERNALAHTECADQRWRLA